VLSTGKGPHTVTLTSERQITPPELVLVASK
jgi:hypothetical protein